MDWYTRDTLGDGLPEVAPTLGNPLSMQLVLEKKPGDFPATQDLPGSNQLHLPVVKEKPTRAINLQE